ncbi:MAG: nuclear transport factor 2 family protein [Sulfurifustis sp.]
MARSTAEIFNDHLARADRGDVEGDIAANFAPDCVLLTTYGRFDGHAGVRRAAALLAEQVPDAKYRYTQRTTFGDVAFLEWTATGKNAVVRDGADSLLIRNDRVQLMTIHYTVQTPPATGR